MSTYDKSDRVGYDDQDRELNEALEVLHSQNARVARLVQQRVHEGILQRMKELGTQKCASIATDLMDCMNNFGLTSDLGLKRCASQRDTLNECYRSVHTEENYQKFRLQMLKGELLQQHAEKTVRRVEAYKAQAPETVSTWKSDYAWRYKILADRLGKNDVLAEDLAFKPFDDAGGGSGADTAKSAQPGQREIVVPSTVVKGTKFEPMSNQAALEQLRHQNQQSQELRARMSSFMVPKPPELSAAEGASAAAAAADAERK